jgi:restriction endonuclease S subunit
MGDIANYINGFAFKPSHWSNEGRPIIRIQNLNDHAAKYNHFAGDIDSKYVVHSGDVLVSWATHLEAYIWDGPEAYLNQHIFRVEFDKMVVDKHFFIYAADEALKIAFKNAHGFKPTMEHIKRGDFENAIINLPEYAIQKEFAIFIEQADKSKFCIRESIDLIMLPEVCSKYSWQEGRKKREKNPCCCILLQSICPSLSEKGGADYVSPEISEVSPHAYEF